ncbi:uncharacterized protein LOC129594788 [Paramacrobiotus metropolitanus]|uniref:uncharacterized protein LOC129594788 n=1 Tax=Paramacrobiotus metropolitanus TaxID=2943436 RepID=UPI002445E0FC|nr:uncharacterized protein LOC129594788 [Paramacrobiotus metropolitanus]
MRNDLERLNNQVSVLLSDQSRKIQECGNMPGGSDSSVARPVPFPRTLRDDSRLADTNEESNGNIDGSPKRSIRPDQESVSGYTSQITQSIHELKRAAENEDHNVLSKCSQRIHTLTHNLCNHCLPFMDGERPAALSDLLTSSNRLLTDCLEFVNETTSGFPDGDADRSPGDNRASKTKAALKQMLIDDASMPIMWLWV